MEQRRQLTMIIICMVFALVWMQLAPALFPQFFKKPVKKNAAQQNALAAKEEDGNKDGDQGKAVADDQPVPEADPNSATENGNSDEANAEATQEPVEELPDFPAQQIVLGRPGFEEGYLIQAQVNTRGGSIDWVQLTDPRYTTVDRKQQLRVVGNPVRRNFGQGSVPQTFDLSLNSIDALLKKHDVSLATVDWDVVSQTPEAITLSYPSPDGVLEVIKTYKVRKVSLESRDNSPDGYLLDYQLKIQNKSEKNDVTVSYSMQGPMGLPLENEDNTRLFREIKLGTLENANNPNSVTAINLQAKKLVDQAEAAQAEEKSPPDWRKPLEFAGVDVQFFAALVFPKDQLEDRNNDGAADPYFESVAPELLTKARVESHSDISLIFHSRELDIPAAGEVTHDFQAFFGPKRPELLNPLNAESIIQLGWFGSISKLMLLALNFFHSMIGLPYAFAIILLTVVVRGAMFPISRKQAIEAEKMKVLAPKLKEIQEKHKGNTEEFARAYKDFQRKHNYHPMMGCLPALLQLPIFLGLYNCLYHAVDLRLAKFLWINDLSAPDGLVQFGFALPIVGWNQLNLLPILTVILFVAQQRLFTPPPTSDEQAMQYKMMNVMMIVIGFMFYRVPGGLCLYFIASSMWGICERMLLKKNVVAVPTGTGDVAVVESGSSASAVDATEKKRMKTPKWLERIVEAADQAKNATEGQNSQRKFSKGPQKKSKFRQ